MSENLKRKRELKKELATIEKQIFDLETIYLEETRDFGNIFTGWDAYLSVEKVKPKKVIYNDDRVFSLSSFTSPLSRRQESKKVLTILLNNIILKFLTLFYT